MEFRCEKCEHVGPAASVKPGAGGVVLVCAACGHENTLEVGGGAEAGSGGEAVPETPVSTPEKPVIDRGRAIKLLRTARPESEEMAEFHEEAMARLVPDPGPGPRCPKCVHLLQPDDEYCGRCGLNVREANRFAPGEAPWERPPQGREDVWEQAELLWATLEDDWNDTNFEKFANFVRDEKLMEFAARKIRFRLVDHPDDAQARAFLKEIAESLQSRIIIARAQARANVEQFSDVTQRARKVILLATLILWLFVLVVLVGAYLF